MVYELVNKEGFKVIGLRRTTSCGGGTWRIVKKDKQCQEVIRKLCGHGYDLGLCFGFEPDGSNDYMCAVKWDQKDVIGLDSYIYPPAQWLVFKGEGSIKQGMLMKLWQAVNHDFLPKSPYQKAGLPTIEKYVKWDEGQDEGKVEIWIPVVLKK